MTTWGGKSYSLKQKMNCFLCDSKDSFFWFFLFVYFCKNCKDLVYIIERGKISKEKIHMFFQYSPYPLFLLYSQCGMVWVSLLLERKTKSLSGRIDKAISAEFLTFLFSSVISAICCFLKWSSLDKQIRT